MMTCIMFSGKLFLTSPQFDEMILVYPSYVVDNTVELNCCGLLSLKGIDFNGKPSCLI